MKSILLTLSATLLLFTVSCDKRKEITEQNVSRIIKTLSSDEMKGRHALHPEIEDAADFISEEFSTFGLETLKGDGNYRQTFTLYSVIPTEASVTVNDQELKEKHFFSITNTQNIDWTQDDVSLKYIDEEDDFQQLFRTFRGDDESSIVVISGKHHDWFHRFRSHFSRANRTMNVDTAPNDLFIIYEEPIKSARVQIKSEIEPIDLFNIVGKIEGKRSDEIVLFSAHYDHIGTISPIDQDSIGNGANDNASGVAGVIELARYYSSGPKPERTLYFVTFTAEEIGGFGSKYFSEQIDPNTITAMVNIEMIGKPAIEGQNTAWITGFDLTTFGQIFEDNSPDGFKFYGDPYPNQNLFYRSDNATLARKGVPAHTISTTPIDVDQDYHQVTDEFNTINISHTTNTIKAIAEVSELLVSGKVTPTRLPVESLN